MSVKAPVFLDRDGTVIVEKQYLGDPRGVSLENGVAAGLLSLQALGHPLFVISNQSGIGRGFFSLSDAQRVNQRADELLREHGICITAWYFCPHLPEAGCECRKPLPGMALSAAREWDVQLPGSYVIGDKRCDLELADAIGGSGILLTTGHGRSEREWALGAGIPVFERLDDAAEFIGRRESASP